MSQTEKGVLIFSEWFEAMKDLKVTEFKALMYAIYRLQIFGEEPPAFQGKAEIIAAFIFPMIRRRMELSEYGSRGAIKRLAADVGASSKKASDDQSASDQASSRPSSQASSEAEASPEAKEKNKKEKYNVAYSPSSRSSKGGTHAQYTRAANGGGAAKSEEEKYWREFFEEATKRALGDA